MWTKLFFLVIAVNSAFVIPFSICETEDGYIIAGTSFSGLSTFGANPFLIKLTRDGEEIWNRSYTMEAQAWSVAKIGNGYVLGGTILGEKGLDVGWIMKVDEKGNPVWQKHYGYYFDGVTTVLSDSRDFLAGITLSDERNPLEKYTWVVKFDEDGNELWRSEFNFKDYDSIKMIRKTNDGFIAVGCVAEKRGDEYANYDVLVVKLNKIGEEEWSKIVDLGFEEVAWDVLEEEDGHLVVGGTLSKGYGQSKAFSIKLDKSGEVKSKKLFEFSDAVAWSVLGDGETLVVGTASENGKNYIWVSNVNETVTFSENFSFLPFVKGVVRAVKAEEGYLITASSCHGECVWVGKLSDGKLLWSREYFLPWNTSKANEVETTAREGKGLTPWVNTFILYAILLIIAVSLAILISKLLTKTL